MTNVEAREEIRNAIAFYDGRGSCWVSAVTFIGIKALFGGWLELTKALQHNMRIYTPKTPKGGGA